MGTAREDSLDGARPDGAGGERGPAQDDPPALALLLHTGRVAGEATVERLLELGIAAEIDYVPNLFVRLLSGGNYHVRVSVPVGELERARAELERWSATARGNVAVLAREVQRALASATLAALLAGGVLAASGVPRALVLGTGLWFALLALWTLRSRRRHRKGGAGTGSTPEAPAPDPTRDGR